MTNFESDLLGQLCHADNWTRHEDKMVLAMSIAKRDFMSSDEGQWVYHAVEKCIANHQKPDMLLISDYLEGKPLLMGSWLGRVGELIKNSGTADNIITVANRIRDDYNAKVVYAHIERAMQSMNELHVPPAQRIKSAMLEISNINPQGNERSSVTAGQALSEMIDKLEWLAEQGSELSGINTGFLRLNQITCGLQKTGNYVIAAQNGIGKTTMAMQILQQAAFMDGKHCLMYSLEMPEDRLMMKFSSSLSNVSFGNFISGKVITDDENCARFANIQHMMDVDNLVIDANPLGVDDMIIRTKQNKMKLGGQLDLIVIDYFGLIRSSGSGDEYYTKIATAIDNLKKEFKCPVITIAQLTKSFIGKPTRKDVRNGGRLCDDADFVGVMWRDNEIGEDFKDGDVLTFAVDKNRYGPITAFGLESALSCSRLIECEKPEQEQFKPKRKDFFKDAKNAN